MTEQQLRIVDLPADLATLTERQRRAFDGVDAAGWDGLTTDEIGALLHHPKHSLNDRCAFCGSAGAEMTRALRAKGLVRQRRRRAPGGDIYVVWTTTDATETPASSDFNKFPESF